MHRAPQFRLAVVEELVVVVCSAREAVVPNADDGAVRPDDDGADLRRWVFAPAADLARQREEARVPHRKMFHNLVPWVGKSPVRFLGVAPGKSELRIWMSTPGYWPGSPLRSS